MPVQHHKKTFTVGSNDKKATLKYRDRYDHSLGKCDASCLLCLEEYIKKQEEMQQIKKEEGR